MQPLLPKDTLDFLRLYQDDQKSFSYRHFGESCLPSHQPKASFLELYIIPMTSISVLYIIALLQFVRSKMFQISRFSCTQAVNEFVIWLLLQYQIIRKLQLKFKIKAKSKLDAFFLQNCVWRKLLLKVCL